jgi:flagellar biogenesis protein FliO
LLSHLTFLLPLPAEASADAGTSSPGVSEINLLWNSFEVILALVFTLILLVGTVWLFKKIVRFRHFPGISGGAIHIIEIHHVDPKKAIALVKILERVMVIAFSENSVTNLGELTREEIESLKIPPRPEKDAFGTILDRLIKKKV